MSTEKHEVLDRTQEAVRKQMAAMVAGTFEVGIFDSDTERMILRTWNEEALFKSIAWLRFENLKGRNIYIRPAGTHSLSLVDDLTADSIARMKREGFAPALVVETSPRNFQAWLQHGGTLDKALSTAVAKALAKRFHGDQGSADWRHFGRLAGFTNRKEKYRQPQGRFPYVRLVETTGTTYQEAISFVPQVQAALTKQIERAAELRRRLHSNPQTGIFELKSIDDFRNDPRYGGAHSRSDLAYAVYALDHGVPEGQMRVQFGSQDLSYLGGPVRQQDYVERIIQKAVRFLNSPRVER